MSSVALGALIGVGLALLWLFRRTIWRGGGDGGSLWGEDSSSDGGGDGGSGGDGD